MVDLSDRLHNRSTPRYEGSELAILLHNRSTPRYEGSELAILLHNRSTPRYEGSELAILMNALLAFVPTVLIAVKQTTTIRASITAYSTAVGPSSLTKKR